jgi:hypothetical protein
MKRYNYKWNLKKKTPMLVEDTNGKFVLLKDVQSEIDYWRQKYEQIQYLERKALW